MKHIMVAPSLLAANFSQLKEEIKPMIEAGIKILHYDVMDGHFVPNISFGAPIVKAITSSFNLIHDVHLMIAHPEQYFQDFIQAGASMITFHVEVGPSVAVMTQWIHHLHQQGIKVGISLKPKTPVAHVLPLLPLVDLVLVMSVEPGFGGQTFMPVAIEKIKELNQVIQTQTRPVLISVDGGINQETGRLCRQAGADILVAGSYLFGQADWRTRLLALTHE